MSCPEIRKVFGFLILEDVTDRLSQNIGEELQLLAAYYPRRIQF